MQYIFRMIHVTELWMIISLVLSLSLQVPHFSSCIASHHLRQWRWTSTGRVTKFGTLPFLCGNKNIWFHTALAKDTFLWATYIHFVFTEWFSRRWRSVSKWWQFHLSLTLRHFYTSLTDRRTDACWIFSQPKKRQQLLVGAVGGLVR